MNEDRSEDQEWKFSTPHPHSLSLSVSGGVLLYSLGWLQIHDSLALASSEGLMSS